jgi:hypothetical protein
MPYTVKSGDTLGAIAAQLGVANWQDLFVNDTQAGDTDPTKLAVGAVIYTPEEGAGGTGGPAAEDGSDSPAGQDGNVEVTQDTTTVFDNAQGVSAASGETTAEAEQQSQQGVGGAGQDPETALTILTGQEMFWSFDERTGKWYVNYGLPNSNMVAVFEADPDQMDALFGEGIRPVRYEGMAAGIEGLLNLPGRVFSGNIAEMAGEGSFEEEVAKATALALDNGLLPEWASQDKAAMDIVYLAQVEGKSAEWTMDQLSNLPSFKQRFPGLDKFRAGQNLTITEAVTGFLEFEAGLKQVLTGVGESAEALHPTMTAALMDKGYSLEVLSEAVGTLKRMKDFAPAMDAFNQILVDQGMDPISTRSEFFQFLRRQAPAEYYDIYEASSVQEAANLAGLGDVFDAGDAMRAALSGDHTRESATAALQQQAQLLLRLRNEVDVGKFGLDHEELIDIGLGMPTRSGRTEAEVNDSINRAIETARGALQQRARPFTGFTQTGTPQAASLSNLRQTS